MPTGHPLPKNNETINYGVRIVDFTKSDNVNSPQQVVFKLINPANGQEIIDVRACNPLTFYDWLNSKPTLVARTGTTMRRTMTGKPKITHMPGKSVAAAAG